MRVVVGASYTTQRSQTNAAFAEIMRGNPELAPTVAPFWAQTLDFPDSDKFAQAMAAMAPPPVKAILEPEGKDDAPDPARLAQQLQEMQAALQEAIQHAQEAQQEADQAQQEATEAKQALKDRDAELEIRAYDSKTKRMQVTGVTAEQAELVVRQLIQSMLDHPEPLPGDDWRSGMPMQDGMGPDESPQHEGMEAPAMEAMQPQEAMEAVEPPGPSPDTQAIVQALGMQAQNHGALAESIAQLAQSVGKPRTKTVMRNEMGDATHLVEE